MRFLACVSVLWLVASAAAAAPCETDPRLEHAAKQLLKTDAQPDSIQLMTVVRTAGSEAIPVYAKYGPVMDHASFKAWLRGIRKEAEGPLVCGRASDGRRAMWVAGVRAARIKVLGNNEVRFSLAKGFRDPRLVVRDATGEIVDLPLGGRGAQSAQIPPSMQEPLLLQLVATGKHGPLPVAERWIGGAPKLGPDNIDRSDPHTWIRALRKARKVPALRENRLLAREASAHATAVCEAGKVAHQVEPDEDPETRLKKRGVSARAIGEAVARAPSAEDAMRSLERSPSHFDTITDKRFTDVGVGGTTDAHGRFCLVVVLAAWPKLTR